MHPRPIDRRELLSTGLALAGGLALGRTASAQSGGASSRPTLLLLQLSGGNDGLNTLVPITSETYRRLRPSIGVAAADALPLSDGLGLHPNLKRLHSAFGAGRLAVVQGVGYPDPIRSHFKSFDVWHTADHAGRSGATGGEGWIGKLCGVAFPDLRDPNLVVHVGGQVPYSLHSRSHPPASFVLPQSYRWAGSERELEAYDRAGMDEDEVAEESASALDRLRRVLSDGQESSREIRRAVARYVSPVDYPDSPLARGLRDVAALANGGLATRVFSIELSGFDTHTDQRGTHGGLLRTLDEALGAFLVDLERTPAGRDLTVLAFSEFGRRAGENASGGTDHGTAAPLFVAGSRVRGGLHGQAPSLTDLDDGDLRHTVDFRSVYATLIAELFGVDPQAVLGAKYPRLELFA